MDLGRLAPILGTLDSHLRDPLKLRAALAAVALGGWYGLAFAPLSARVEESGKRRGQAEAHLELAREIEALRVAAADFKGRVPSRVDTNEWVEYVLAGVRRFPVRLLRLEPMGVRKHGPFNLAQLSLELQGTYRDLDAVLGWVESNPRLMRVDGLSIAPASGKGKGIDMKLNILGLGE